MALKRNKMKEIYDGLPNSEKTRWAQNAGYSSYQGLYRYISKKGEEVAYNRVVVALQETVGEERFENLTVGERDKIKIPKINQQVHELLDNIFGTGDPESYRYDIFADIAEREGFDTSAFFELETQMTDMLRCFSNSDELVEKIRVATRDIVNTVIVQNFAIPMVQEKLED